MKAQFENKVMSSLLLYMDNTILKQGEAFTNHSGLFYPDKKNLYNGYYGYSSPYKQLVNDKSITGASILTGVYVNSSFTTGVNINHYNGQVFFNSDQGSAKISGSYAIKDFNISMTSKPEQDLLFETKFHLRPKVNQTITGLSQDQDTFPAIYVKNMGGSNVPFAFGGMDNTFIRARAIVLSDSAYKLDAVSSILKDTARYFFRIIEPTGLPFNALGLSATGQGYNYTGVTSTAHGYDTAYISDVKVTSNMARMSNGAINSQIYPAFVDFTLETPRATSS